jgi:hypothetical protein
MFRVFLIELNSDVLMKFYVCNYFFNIKNEI